MDAGTEQEQHEVPFRIEDEWVVSYGRLPAVRATWYPRKETGRLDVEVLLDRGEIIRECFAGTGTADAGKSDGLLNFCINLFHVLLAAFWQRNDPHQVTAELGRIGEKSYTAFIGNFGTRSSAEANPEIPCGLLGAIESPTTGESLTRDCYWARHFFCDIKGEQTFEALLNNEDWAPGLQALKSIRWSKSIGYYSVRNFMVLRATPG